MKEIQKQQEAKEVEANTSNNIEENAVKFPMNIYEGNIGDKKCDYKTLAIMTLYSKHKPFNEEDSDEQYRFVYRGRLIEFTDEIEQLSKNKMNTVLRNIKKLSNLSGGLVNASRTNDGKIFYTINYRNGEVIYNEEGKPIKITKGSFVLVEEDLLRFLVDVGNNNDIKVYLFIKALCEWNERTHGKKEMAITRDYICEHIGLLPYEKNLQSISNITFMLEECHLIKKRLVKTSVDGRYITKLYYSIVPYEEWKAYIEASKNKDKKGDDK